MLLQIVSWQKLKSRTDAFTEHSGACAEGKKVESPKAHDNYSSLSEPSRTPPSSRGSLPIPKDRRLPRDALQ